eukprot:2236484-Pyramimonas_sp.AAC.1
MQRHPQEAQEAQGIRKAMRACGCNDALKKPLSLNPHRTHGFIMVCMRRPLSPHPTEQASSRRPWPCPARRSRRPRRGSRDRAG